MIEQLMPSLSGTIIDDIVLLVIGLGLLIKGADYFVKSSASLARRFGISELVIGLTLVAVGTSLPELVSAIVASLKQEGGLVMGNVVGANIANITIIVGGAAALRAMPIDRSMLERDGYLALLAAVLMGAFALNHTISRIEGMFFLLLFVAYTSFLVQTSQQYERAYHIRDFSRYFFKFGYVTGTVQTISRSIRNHRSHETSPAPANQPFDWKNLALLVFSVILIALGGNFLVEEAIFFSDFFGLPVTFVGVILALGTTAPEMSVSIAAARQGMGGMVIGNAIGSVLSNTFLILGVASLISPIAVSTLALRYAIPCLIGVTVLLLIFKKSNLQIGRIEGAFLCVLYIAFIVGYGILA